MSARSSGTAHLVLSPIWDGYRAKPRSGRLELRHWFLNDDVTAIPVDAVEPVSRRPRAREFWRINVSDARVLTLHTPEGIVELAVAAGHVDWLLAQLAGADLPASD